MATSRAGRPHRRGRRRRRSAPMRGEENGCPSSGVVVTTSDGRTDSVLYGNHDLQRGDHDRSPTNNRPPRWGGRDNPPPLAQNVQTPMGAGGATVAVPGHVQHSNEICASWALLSFRRRTVTSVAIRNGPCASSRSTHVWNASPHSTWLGCTS